MPAYGIVDSEELAILTRALDEYCAEHRVASKEDRELVALRVMSLFRRGVTQSDQLSRELERVR
ncbi:hypothetical protein FJW06_19950 [Mesorhizobium sp. B4-1-3]|uniref:hypothetical protein n=1 Tax=Mesorhizobium sp. B4-1-3 TaxID=2589889 RepID=UPI00112DEE77|nr:hypothetical protein [Mesorhizobium sp. B4-1-3]TPI11633.1 hypothetical protein FJW06_19950 [Mesorhizobium sp. B4-1-3]